jgi:iron complex outermembrane recepter protein
MIKKLKILAVMVLSSLSALASAETEQDYLQELPVVLSASRLLQPVSEAPNAMTVISRNMIRASGFRNVTDLFKLVPGMYVSYYKGAQPIVSYHSTLDQYARSMQVLIDGRSVYMPPSSTVDWSSLPITLADIERVEVIRGPAAAAYGANSVHGVINIITLDAGALHGGGVAVTRGDKGVNDVQAQVGHHGEKLNYRMTLAYTADNGYDNRTATHLPSATPSDMNNSNDSNQARLFNYRASYVPTAQDNFDVQFGLNNDVQGVGFTNHPSQSNPFHDLFKTNSFQLITWLHHTENLGEVTLRAAHTRTVTQENFLAFPPFNVAVSQSVAGDRQLLSLQHNLLIGEPHRLVYGAEWSQDEVVGTTRSPLANPPLGSATLNIPAKRFFAHDEWRINDTVVSNLGGMWENDGMTGTKFSPRAALNWHVSPEHTLRVGGSIAYRSPSLVENYGVSAFQYQMGDRFTVGATSSHLAAEKYLSREIGYLGQFNERATSLDLRAYRDQFGAGIYLKAPGIYNGLAGEYDGVESTLKHSLNQDTSIILNVTREFAHSNSNAIKPGVDDTIAASLPTHLVSALFAQHLDNGISYSASYYQQSGSLAVYSNLSDYQKLHRRVDFRVALDMKSIAGNTGELAWVVQNVFQDNYTEFAAKNVFNQRNYVTLKLDF